MPRKLCVLKDSFFIDGRGAVLVLPAEDEWEMEKHEKLYRFERIRLVTPSGSEVSTFIKDLDYTVRHPDRTSDLCFILPLEIKRGEIPEGSEVWLERDGELPVIWEGAPKQEMHNKSEQDDAYQRPC